MGRCARARLVLATGAIVAARSVFYRATTGPGIMLRPGGQRTWLNRYGRFCRGTAAAVVVTACDEAYRAALEPAERRECSSPAIAECAAPGTGRSRGADNRGPRRRAIPVLTRATVLGNRVGRRPRETRFLPRAAEGR